MWPRPREEEQRWPPPEDQTFESSTKCNRRPCEGPPPSARARLPEVSRGPPNGAGPPAAPRSADVARGRDSNSAGGRGQFNVP